MLTVVALVIGTAASLAPPALAKVAIDEGIDKHDTTTLVLVVVALLAAAGVVLVMTRVQTYMVGWVGQRTLADLRIKIFRHLQEMPIGFYESRPVGILISRITNDVEALESLVTDSVVMLFQSGLTLIGVVVIMFVLDVHLALIALLVVPLLLAGSLWFRSRPRVPSAAPARRSARSPATCRRACRESVLCAASPGRNSTRRSSVR